MATAGVVAVGHLEIAVRNAYDRELSRLFPNWAVDPRSVLGVVVRKDLVKAVKGNAIVPTYVLEYLLAQYAATNDEATIR
ncbi:MAG: BREX system Lon protease-like protein BrxL, partial [Bifidobacteriaceae bacterium]|nr:BREX system Lon protease-like protein BrxL [Bifidobacteriaceae bacterium]